MTRPDLTVSVVLTTYNHRPHIARAIDGVLMQRADFAWELLIGEDCSRDGTRDVVIDYARSHPDRIRLFLSDVNLGGHANLRRLLRAAAGRYVALLEGDDQWTDPEKLRKQAAYLDARPDVALCFHRTRILDETAPGHGDRLSAPPPDAVTTISDICRRNYINTSSVMFRGRPMRVLPDWMDALPLGDWPLFILLAHHGAIGYLDEVMGLYRIHPGGIWATRPRRDRRGGTRRVAEALRRHVAPRVAPHMNRSVTRWCAKGFKDAFRERDFGTAVRFLTKAAGTLARHPGLLIAARRSAVNGPEHAA